MKPPPPAPPRRQTLEERVAAWEKIVAALERGWRFDLDDWLNDMDLRQMIEDSLALYGPDERGALDIRLAKADADFRLNTVEAGKCLWGKKAAKREKWSATTNWWYFRKPRRAETPFIEEVERVK